MTRKHKKYSSEWNMSVAKIATMLDKNKGSRLETTIEKINQTKQDLNDKKVQLKGLENIPNSLNGLKVEDQRVKTLLTAERNKMNNFLGGSGATAPWRTEGWDKKTTDYYTPLGEKMNNLYKFRDYTITEEQAIKLLAKVVYELGSIDNAQWNTEYSGADKVTLQPFLTHLIEQGQAIRARNEKGGFAGEIDKSKFVYDLPQSFTKSDGSAYTAHQFQFANVFTLLSKLDDSLLDKLNDATKITQTENWKVIKSGDVYTPEELVDYGIKIDLDKTQLYRSAKRGADGKWIQETEEVKVENGLKGWVHLLKELFAFDLNQVPLKKLIAAYTNSPTEQLLSDIRAGTVFVSGDGGDTYANKSTTTANYRLPETKAGTMLAKAELKAKLIDKDYLKQKAEGQQEVTQLTQQLVDKSNEYDELINEVLTAYRKQLIEKYKCDKGFTKISDTEDYRKNRQELFWIQRIIKNIRFINTGDEADATGATAEENNYLTTAEGIIRKFFPATTYPNYEIIMLVEVFWSELRYEHGSDQQAIAAWKQDPINHEFPLSELDKAFAEVDQIIRLAEHQKRSWQAVRKELGKDTGETALEWRNKLNEIDPTLNDPALINEAWKDKWTALDKFKKAEEVKALFDKIKGKSDFLTELPTISGETSLNALKAMVAKKPTEIIRYIETYWFNHLPDTDADEKKKEKTQMKRRIAKALNKTKESDLPDSDIPENLVKIKTGELAVDMTKFYSASLQELKNEKPKEERPPFLRWSNPWVYAIGALFAGIVAAIIYWDKIVAWYNKPADGQATDDDHDEDNDL